MTLAEAAEILRAAGVDTEHVVFAPTDFQQRSWLRSLCEHGFDPQQPTFVLWEGVTMYLDDDAVAKTLGEIASFPSGSQVTFDYFSRELVRAHKPFVFAGLYARYALRAFYGENWGFGLSTVGGAAGPATAYVEGLGLQARATEAVAVSARAGASLGGLLLAEVPDR